MNQLEIFRSIKLAMTLNPNFKAAASLGLIKTINETLVPSYEKLESKGYVEIPVCNDSNSEETLMINFHKKHVITIFNLKPP